MIRVFCLGEPRLPNAQSDRTGRAPAPNAATGALFLAAAMLIATAADPTALADERRFTFVYEATTMPAGDADALAAALARVRDDPAYRAELEAGARAVARRYSWRRIARQTLDAYGG